jgi:hypothetical protein
VGQEVTHLEAHGQVKGGEETQSMCPIAMPVAAGIVGSAKMGCTASISTTALNVGKSIGLVNAKMGNGGCNKHNTLNSGRPCYVHLMWSRMEAGRMPTATYMETALPIADIPKSKFKNVDVTATLAKAPNLFKIIMPINIHALQLVLTKHPNHALANSLV